MVLKIFRAFWLLSVLVTLAVLLFVYASLPEQVVVLERAAKLISLPRDGVFYIALGLMTLINALVYAISRFFKDTHFHIWFYGLVMTLNTFFIISLSLINTFNSGEKFNYQQIDFIIYGSVLLMVLWAVGWPFYSLFRNFFHKPTI